MLEFLLIIAAVASASMLACGAVQVVFGSVASELINISMDARWLSGDVHQRGGGGLWPPGRGGWTVAAALARPAPDR
jgi:hypothetical protein